MAETTASVEETVRKIVTKIVRKPETAFTTASTFKDLEADSLDIVQILVAIEDAFGVEIKDEDLQKVTNMDGFIKYIEQKVAEKGK